MIFQNNSLAIAPNAVSGSELKVGQFVLFVLAGVALIALSAKIQVPFFPVPMTLQTLAIMGIAAAYGLRLGVSTILAYLVAGFAGAPVFAGPIAGPAYFMGPTAGFLLGFIVIAAMVGYAADKGIAKSPAKLFATMLLAADPASLERLKTEPISAIYVTTMQRTHQTAAPLAAHLGLVPAVEADLRAEDLEGGLLVGNSVRGLVGGRLAG